MIQQVTPETLRAALPVFESYREYLGGLDLEHLHGQLRPLLESGQVVMFHETAPAGGIEPSAFDAGQRIHHQVPTPAQPTTAGGNLARHLDSPATVARGRGPRAGGADAQPTTSVIAAMVFVSPYLPELTVQVVAWKAESPFVAAALLRRVLRWAKEISAARVVVLHPGEFPVKGWAERETYYELPLERKVA